MIDLLLTNNTQRPILFSYRTRIYSQPVSSHLILESTMFDSNWFWVIAELGVSYGMYRWWKASDTVSAILEAAPDLDIDDLKKFSSSTTSIEYAVVHGLIQTNDSKSNSVLTSQFVSDCTGVIQRLTIREQKLEKLRNTWTETKHLISDVKRYVPFRLVSAKGNSVRINKPLDFQSIENQLEVTHVKFDSHIASSIQKIVGSLIGNVSTGLETREQMLLVGIPLTGIGRLEKRSGVWYLIPHEQRGGILSRLTRQEILADYRRNSDIARVLSLLFGALAGCTIVYLLYRFYSKHQQLTVDRTPRVVPTIRRIDEDNQNNRLQCVICLENEIMYSLQPCSHLGLCQHCTQRLQASHQGQELCPICRAPIQQYQRVFLP